MGFKVIYKGLEVICDTFEDLDVLADKIKAHKGHSKPPVENNTPTLFSNGKGTYSDFVKALSVKPLSVMQILTRADRPMTDTELRTALNLESNMQLAGYMSSITKAAQKTNFAVDDVIKKEVLSSIPGDRAYKYSIPVDASEKIKEALNRN